jgi:hypothetical protein
MKFGDRQTFAVEFQLDEVYGGTWLFGEFCYWIDGVQVGDYNLSTSLGDVLSGMMWIVHDCGNRDGGILCKLSPWEAFCMIDSSMYVSDECQDADESQLPDTPARFEIRIPVEIFNGWKIYLIECAERALVYFKHSNDAEVRVANLPVGIFDRVIKEAYVCLNELYDNEVLAAKKLNSEHGAV